MIIAILGAGGFIGTALARRLAAAGHEVRAGVRRATTLPAGIHGIESAYDTLEHFTRLVAGCDLVIHAAGSSTPAASRDAPLVEVEENLRATLLLCQAVAASGVPRLVYLSSAGTVYGNVDAGCAEEQWPVRPLSNYGAGKVAAEAFLHALSSAHAVDATVIRATNVYGPGQRTKKGFALVPWAVEAQRTGIELPVSGDGGSLRDYLFIEDLCDAVEALLARGGAERFEVFNAGAGEIHSVLEVLAAIESIGGGRIRRRFVPRAAGEVSRVAVSIARLAERTGWRPRTPLRAGLEATLAWHSTLDA